MAKAPKAPKAAGSETKVYISAQLLIDGVPEPVDVKLYPRKKQGKENDFSVHARSAMPGRERMYTLNGWFSEDKADKGTRRAVSWGGAPGVSL